jgi:hypothetical protein
MTKQKKPKSGDVVGWAVINRVGGIHSTYLSRKEAREARIDANIYGGFKPYRIGKVIVA